MTKNHFTNREQVLLDIRKKSDNYRLVSIDAVDDETRTVSLAFSSEAEIDRWYGVEVLDHSADSVVLDRIRDGAPLLLDHSTRSQIGVIESVEVGADRRGRSVVRFGKSTLADEIFNDIKDGIRKHVSVGYMVHSAKCIETRISGEDVWLVTKWEPYEISIVSVPADHSVGIGRSMQTPTSQIQNLVLKETAMEGSQNATPTPNTASVVDATAERNNATEQERARVRSILSMGEQFKAKELANDYVREGKTVSEFQRGLLDNIHSKTNSDIGLANGKDAKIGLNDRDISKYSVVKVLRALANPENRAAQQEASFEFEASQAARDRAGKETKNFVIPFDVLSSRAMNSGKDGSVAGNTGGFTIATNLLADSFIDVLRNRCTLLSLGVPLVGLVGNVDIPKKTKASQGYWVGEGAQTPETSAEFGNVVMSPKTAAAFVPLTRRLIHQSSLDIESLVRVDIAHALALVIDKAGFYGTGGSTEPNGLLKMGITATPYKGDFPGFQELTAMETAIAAQNADVPSMAYVVNPAMRGFAKTTLKFPNIAGSGTVWEQGNTMCGYRVEVTNQLNAGDIFLGNFADFIIGMWGGLELLVDPYSGSRSGLVNLTAFQDVDFAIRRPSSFAVGQKATAK